MPENKEILITQETENQKPETRISKDGMIDVEARAHVPENVKTWLQKIEMDPTQMKTVNDDAGQPVLKLTAPTDPRVQLPTTRQSFLTGFAKKIDEAGKWLSIFLLRVIKIHGGKVKFKEE